MAGDRRQRRPGATPRRVAARLLATPWMALRLLRCAPDRRSASINLHAVVAMWWARRTGSTARERTLTVCAGTEAVSLAIGDLSEAQVVDEIFVNDVYAEVAA